MQVDQVCEGAKQFGYSWWPSLHWWMSLKAADQGAWAAGFGAFLAAVAAVGVSWWERRSRKKEAKVLSRLTAAYLYVPAKRILNFMGAMQTHGMNAAAVMAGTASINVGEDINMLEIACKQVRPLRERIALADMAKLEWTAAAPLAVVVSEIDQLLDAVEATALAFRTADQSSDPDATRVKSARQLKVIVPRVNAISGRLETFIANCKRRGIPEVT